MNPGGNIVARMRSVHLTRRAAILLVAPVPVIIWLPAAWPWVVSIVWALGWLAVVRRDLAATSVASQLTIERTLPVKLSIGVPNTVKLSISNDSDLAIRVEGRESPPALFLGERGFGPVGILPQTSVDVELVFTPPERGAYEFGPVAVRVGGPRGMAGRQIKLDIAEEARVYPDIQAIHGYSLLARRGATHEMGLRNTRLIGVGTEFESLREYQDGDNYRDIDWKATARYGSPVVRRFEAERSQTIMLAIDAGRLMTPRIDGMSKLDRGINAALLLSYLATQAGDNVGLMVFGREVRTFLPPRKGHRQFLAILEALYGVEEQVEEPDYAGALRYMAGRVSRRSLVVLFTELVGTEPSRRLIGVLGSLAPRHLPMVLTQRSVTVEEMAVATPAAEGDAFESGVAQQILHHKAEALRVLQSRGAIALDVVPGELSVAAVNRYLEIKSRGRL